MKKEEEKKEIQWISGGVSYWGRYSLTGPLSVSGWTKAVSHLGRTTQVEREIKSSSEHVQ